MFQGSELLMWNKVGENVFSEEGTAARIPQGSSHAFAVKLTPCDYQGETIHLLVLHFLCET